jgi:O-methyltransferase involved in polyketide biosynthesis
VTEPPARGSDAISPTAHYTGAVWARNGLSTPELETALGRLSFLSVLPAAIVSGALGGPTLEQFLLARHRLIDLLLGEAIAAGRITQVLEIAAGMSPRGWRFARDHPEITYLEGDLPAMAKRKRAALERAGSLTDRHRVVEIDALADEGELSLSAVADALRAEQGVAVITEGLLPYLDRGAAAALWRRIASMLTGFPDGMYLSDIHLADENPRLVAAAFLRGLSLFVRSRVDLHFDTAEEAEAALLDAGFGTAVLHRPLDFADRIEVGRPGAEMVRVLEARPS